MAAPQTNCKVILATNIAKTLLTEIKSGLESLGRQPHLLGILANSDPAAKLYADWTQKTCIEK
jgi:methylenetetrahydrofolate dehydrogenase (NAD+)